MTDMTKRRNSAGLVEKALVLKRQRPCRPAPRALDRRQFANAGSWRTLRPDAYWELRPLLAGAIG